MTITAEEIARLEALLERIEYLDDCGPRSEGWQSDELMVGIATLRDVIARAKAER